MPKLLSTFAAVIFLTPAFAFANEVCSKFMPCGTYEGTGRWYKADGTPAYPDDFTEKIVIEPRGKRGVRVSVYFGKEPKLWSSLNLKFDARGSFRKLTNKGDVATTGICANKVCTVAFYPVKVKKGSREYVNSFVNILRFEGDQLTRYNTVANNSDDSELLSQRSHLTRK